MNALHSPDVRRALDDAGVCARELRHATIGTHHLLFGLFNHPQSAAVKAIKARYQLTPERIRLALQNHWGAELLRQGWAPNKDVQLLDAIDAASAMLQRTGGGELKREHLLLMLLPDPPVSWRGNEDNRAQELLRLLNITNLDLMRQHLVKISEECSARESRFQPMHVVGVD